MAEFKYSFEQIWNLSTMEAAYVLDASDEISRLRQKNAAVTGWFSASLQRAKRMPTLKDHLKHFSRSKIVSKAEWSDRKEHHEAMVAIHEEGQRKKALDGN